MWPAIRAAHLFENREVFEEERARRPWAFRISDSGEAVVLTRWREHLDLLHIRAAWCIPSHVALMLAQVRGVGEELGLPLVVSPMLDERAIGPYARAGLTRRIPLVSYKASPASVVETPAPVGVAIREARAEDAPALVDLERACFSVFWRHGPEEVSSAIDSILGTSRTVVAEGAEGVIGYTLSVLSRASATLARIAVRPDAQGRGVGRALVWDAAEFAGQAGASLLSLCTQESNVASRALYGSMGFTRLGGRMVLVADPSVPA
jgi:ribosomal protein S18 acetylase RimI-like enzyme